jgi:hypothetical protein
MLFILCGCYILSLSFQNVLPGVIQLPEIIFALILATSVIFQINFIPKKINLFDKGLIIYLAAITFSALLHNITPCWTEISKSFYLTGVYCVFRFITSSKKENSLQYFSRYFILLGLIAGATGIAGYFYSLATCEQFLVSTYGDFPYTGTIRRLIGFTDSPTMFILLITTSLFFLLENISRKNKISFQDAALVLLFIFAGLLTLSKSIVLMLTGILLFFIYKKTVGTTKKILSRLVLSGSLIVMVIGTHLIISKKQQISSANTDVPYTSPVKVIETENYRVNLSIYSTLKKLAIKTGTEDPIKGCGPGQFQNALSKMKAENNYPNSYPLFLPHSTITGAFAETGIPGLIGVLVFICSIIIFYTKNKNAIENQFGPVVKIILLLLLIEMISTDVMHIRHYWILFGLIAGVQTNRISSSTNTVRA